MVMTETRASASPEQATPTQTAKATAGKIQALDIVTETTPPLPARPRNMHDLKAAMGQARGPLRPWS
jgi:hypothetical protein